MFYKDVKKLQSHKIALGPHEPVIFSKATSPQMMVHIFIILGWLGYVTVSLQQRQKICSYYTWSQIMIGRLIPWLIRAVSYSLVMTFI